MLAAQTTLDAVLLSLGILDQAKVDQIKLEMARKGKSFKDLALEQGLVDKNQMAKAEGVMWNVPYFDERNVGSSPEAMNLVPQPLAIRFRLFPLALDKENQELIVVMENPRDLEAIDFLTRRSGMKVKPYIGSPDQVETLISERYSQGLSGDISEALRENEDKAKIVTDTVINQDESELIKQPTVVQVVSRILEHAVKSGASDIHIEPEEDRTRIRYRIDGILQEKLQLPRELHAGVISRIKILSGMKIDEKRIPQDGRYNYKIDDREVDLRVSSLPTVHGEKIVRGIKTKDEKAPTLPELGLRGRALKSLEEAILVPHGIILITGPTGSGKTTTLYSVITRISSPKVNIVTVEDPVEYQMKGVNQVQVNPQAGLTFAMGLRAFLRQDPNIIMVGEIRDEETADLAVQAALTGHLVFSTVHTNSAAGALPRLIDMKAEPFLLASSITAIVGQRVVRRICEACKESYVPTQAVIDDIKMTLGNLHEVLKQDGELRLYRGKGCIECGNVGYRGRMGIYEVLSTNEKIGRLIMERSDADTIERTATESGMILMKQDGYMKALEGITTLEEVLRVAQV